MSSVCISQFLSAVAIFCQQFKHCYVLQFILFVLLIGVSDWLCVLHLLPWLVGIGISSIEQWFQWLWWCM